MREPAMKEIRPFLICGLAAFLVGATVYGSVAQTSPAQPKAETRLITLGTVAGPPPRPHRAQFSNLLFVTWASFSLRTITRLTLRGLVRSCRPHGTTSA